MLRVDISRPVYPLCGAPVAEIGWPKFYSLIISAPEFRGNNFLRKTVTFVLHFPKGVIPNIFKYLRSCSKLTSKPLFCNDLEVFQYHCFSIAVRIFLISIRIHCCSSSTQNQKDDFDRVLYLLFPYYFKIQRSYFELCAI